jgi:hypothetical protein
VNFYKYLGACFLFTVVKVYIIHLAMKCWEIFFTYNGHLYENEVRSYGAIIGHHKIRVRPF